MSLECLVRETFCCIKPFMFMSVVVILSYQERHFIVTKLKLNSRLKRNEKQQQLTGHKWQKCPTRKRHKKKKKKNKEKKLINACV